MFHSDWKTCLIDINRDSEFAGDDVDQYSKLVDLGRAFEKLVIIVPTIDSAAITVYVQRSPGTDQVPVAVHHGYMYDASGAGNAWTTAAWTTTAGTGGFSITCNIDGHQFVRIRAGANQAADRTFYLRGVRS